MINYKQAAKAKQTVEFESFFKLYIVSHDVNILYLRLTNKMLQSHLLLQSHILLFQFFTRLNDYSLSNKS